MAKLDNTTIYGDLNVNNVIATEVITATILCGTTCAVSPVTCGTTRVYSPIVCGTTCVRGAVICATTSFSGVNVTSGNDPGHTHTAQTSVTGNAGSATTLYINSDESGDNNNPILFTSNTTQGNKPVYEDSAFYFDNTSNILHSLKFCGTLCGNAATATCATTAGALTSLTATAAEINCVADGNTAKNDHTHLMANITDSTWTSHAEPGIFSGSGTPTLATDVTGAEVRSLIGAGTSSSPNVTTNITVDEFASVVCIYSSDGGDDSIAAATSTKAGVMSCGIHKAHVLNNAKVTDANHNVSTNITVDEFASLVCIYSSDGGDDSIAAATSTLAGVMSCGIHKEHVLNNAKVSDVNHNVTTNITVDESTSVVCIYSSDGGDDSIAAATSTKAGVMSCGIHKEHVVNNGKVSNVTQTTVSGNAGSATTVFVNEYNSTTTMRVLGSHNGINSDGNVYSNAGIYMNMSTDWVYAKNFSLTSDINEKRCISSADPKNIDDIKIISYKFNNSGILRHGIIAQDAEESHPELVSVGDDNIKSVSYIDYLILKMAKKDEEIKEINNRFDDLERRIKLMEDK